MTDLSILIPLSIGLLVGALAWRYATRRVRLAERLMRDGWVCVGFNFLTGPIVVPPEALRIHVDTQPPKA